MNEQEAREQLLKEQEARQLVLKLSSALTAKFGPAAEMLIGPMMMLPPQRVVQMCDEMVAMYRQLREVNV